MWTCCSQCSPNFKRGRSTSPGPCCQTGAHPPVYCRPRPSGASLRLPARRYALASFFVMFRCPGQGRGEDTVRLPHPHRGTPLRDGFKRPDLGQCHPKSVAGGIQTTLFVTPTREWRNERKKKRVGQCRGPLGATVRLPISPVSYRFTPNVAPGSVPAMNVSRIAPAAPGSVTAPVIGSTEVKTMLAGGTNRSAVSRPSM